MRIDKLEKTKKDSPIYFSSNVNKYDQAQSLFLSPRYSCSFIAFDSQTYHSCTDYYLTQQFMILDDEANAKRIHEIPIATNAHKLATELTKGKEKTENWKKWEESKVQIMKDAIKMKFDQNPRLQQKLLKTGNQKLVGDFSKDLFWYCDV